MLRQEAKDGAGRRRGPRLVEDFDGVVRGIARRPDRWRNARRRSRPSPTAGVSKQLTRRSQPHVEISYPLFIYNDFHRRTAYVNTAPRLLPQNARGAPMLFRQVSLTEKGWYHSFELPDGRKINGTQTME